jgi:hypothetical protein
MTELVQEVTAEQIAQHYKAAMDSVNLLLAGKPEDMTAEDWADTVKRNKEHLSLQLNKEVFYDGYDLQPFKDAIAL